MKLDSVRSVIALGLALQLCAFSVFAASPAIGTASTKGAFRVDAATVNGNATLFDGSVVETDHVTSTLDLTSGARVLLASASKGTFHTDRVVLEKGEGQLENAAHYKVEALGLTILPESSATSGRVVMNDTKVQVHTQSGSLRVLNSQGVLVASIAAGRALELEPLKAPAPSRITGTPESRQGKLVLTDETTSVTLELAGQGVEKELGNRISVTGSVDSNRRMQVTQLARLQKQETSDDSASSDSAAGNGKREGSKKDKAAPAAVGGAAAGAAVGGILGMSTATVAVIGGVAAAATMGGLAASNKLPGQSSGSPSASR